MQLEHEVSYILNTCCALEYLYTFYVAIMASTKYLQRRVCPSCMESSHVSPAPVAGGRACRGPTRRPSASRTPWNSENVDDRLVYVQREFKSGCLVSVCTHAQ